MSALNICIKPDRCIVLQDAAAYDRDGRITDWVDKGRVVETNGLFVAATGSIAAVPVFAMFAELFTDIDDLAAHGEADAGGWYDRHRAFLKKWGGEDVFVAFIGWSAKSDRPMCVVFAVGADGRAFAVDVGTLTHPMLEGEFRTKWMAGSNVYFNIDTFDAERDGLRLMELQRAQPADMTGRAGQYLVGGHIKLTMVFRDRVEQRVLHEWTEDRIGSPIEPAACRSNVVSLSSSSRAERRRLEKQQRRGAA